MPASFVLPLLRQQHWFVFQFMPSRRGVYHAEKTGLAPGREASSLSLVVEEGAAGPGKEVSGTEGKGQGNIHSSESK